MTRKNRPVVRLFSQAKLRNTIKEHGLQIYMFDTSLLSLEWDGLEYQFRIQNGNIFLEKILVRYDVSLGRVEIHEHEVHENWVHLNFW